MCIIPADCTDETQAPDVSWNKPFKTILRDRHSKWLASDFPEYTNTGNMKPISVEAIASHG